jgi:20S proteasome subunit alpha 7
MMPALPFAPPTILLPLPTPPSRLLALARSFAQILADRLSAFKQAYTCYGSVRPFGISTLLAGIDKTGPRLFCIEPSGVFYGYRACAIGKGRALARTELEKVVGREDGVGVSCREGVMEIARM